MKSVYKSDVIRAGLEALRDAKDYSQPENIRARTEIANAYARLAEAMGDTGVVVVADETL